jgi:hypothetical protein
MQTSLVSGFSAIVLVLRLMVVSAARSQTPIRANQRGCVKCVTFVCGQMGPGRDQSKAGGSVQRAWPSYAFVELAVALHEKGSIGYWLLAVIFFWSAVLGFDEKL